MAAEPQTQSRIKPTRLANLAHRMAGAVEHITCVQVIPNGAWAVRPLHGDDCYVIISIYVRDGVNAEVEFHVSVDGVSVRPSTTTLYGVDHVRRDDGVRIDTNRFETALTHADAVRLMLDVLKYVRASTVDAEVDHGR